MWQCQNARIGDQFICLTNRGWHCGIFAGFHLEHNTVPSPTKQWSLGKCHFDKHFTDCLPISVWTYNISDWYRWVIARSVVISPRVRIKRVGPGPCELSPSPLCGHPTATTVPFVFVLMPVHPDYLGLQKRKLIFRSRYSICICSFDWDLRWKTIIICCCNKLYKFLFGVIYKIIITHSSISKKQIKNLIVFFWSVCW